MYTLKIHWISYDRAGLCQDETTLFIPADSVAVHGAILEIEGETPAMDAWDLEDWRDYRNVSRDARLPEGHEDEKKRASGQLICVTRDSVDSWYVASKAWLLGPGGATIERLAP